jgi:hypothetical protein
VSCVNANDERISEERGTPDRDAVRDVLFPMMDAADNHGEPPITSTSFFDALREARPTTKAGPKAKER